MTMLHTSIVAVSQNVPVILSFPDGQTRGRLRNILAVNLRATWARAAHVMQLAAKQPPASSEFYFTARHLTSFFHKHGNLAVTMR